MSAGGDGSLHFAWYRPGVGLGHARRDSGGNWSPAFQVAPAEIGATELHLVADTSGNAHLAWTKMYSGPVSYRRRSASGEWSDTADLSGTGGILGCTLAVSPQGTVHALWWVGALYHAWQQGSEPWTAPARVPGADPWAGSAWVAIEPDGTLHAAWPARLAVWASRWQAGAWEQPAAVWQVGAGNESYGEGALAVDARHGAHVAGETRPAGLYERTLLYSQSDQVAQAGDSLLQQAVVVPAGGTPVLSFLYRLSRASAEGQAGLRVTLDAGGGPVELMADYESSTAWIQASLDLTPWAGQAATLGLAVNQIAGLQPVELALDEVTMGSAYPDLWVTKSGPLGVQAGMPVDFVLRYGNRGGAPAGAVALTDTLPAGLTFVWADPPPSTTEPFLTWQVGDLPARSGPFTIVLHALAAPGLAPGTTLVNALQIESASEELETLNNQAQAEIWIGYPIFVPLVTRAR
jgi:uncharacterized repeat protein (TIGR01451 family)